MTEMIVRWYWVDEDEVHECTWSEWLADNAECCPEDLAEIERALRAGGERKIGGGAAPTMVLRFARFEVA